MTNTYDLMFDADLCVGAGSLLASQHQIAAVAEEYEPGMSHIRIDPLDPTLTTGFIVIPGNTPNQTPGWLVLTTEKITIPQTGEVFFDTAEGDYGTNLNLDLNAPLDAVAAAVAAHLAATVDLAGYTRS